MFDASIAQQARSFDASLISLKASIEVPVSCKAAIILADRLSGSITR